MCKMRNQAPATLNHQAKYSYIDGITGFSLWPDNISYEVLFFIGCQFALESNFGTSSLARNHNNHCGMKIPKVRPTFNTESAGTFASYPTLEDCVADYFVWLVYNRFSRLDLQNLEAFKDKLVKSGYCPEPDYIQKIMNIYNKYYVASYKPY